MTAMCCVHCVAFVLVGMGSVCRASRVTPIVVTAGGDEVKPVTDEVAADAIVVAGNPCDRKHSNTGHARPRGGKRKHEWETWYGVSWTAAPPAASVVAM